MVVDCSESDADLDMIDLLLVMLVSFVSRFDLGVVYSF